ncbi:MAG: hypothetical protein R3F46_09465 [bacterium]
MKAAAWLLPLFCLVWLAASPRGSASQLPASGNGLYDRLASLIDDDLRASGQRLLVPDDYLAGSALIDIRDCGRISSERLLGWEAEFSGDMRYWELRCLLRSDCGSTGYLAAEPCLAGLEGAWERGLRSEAACRLLADNAAPAEQQLLLSEALRLWPDNAYWHYRSAELQIAGGKLEAAAAAMQSGNRAVRTELPRPWPLGLLDADDALPVDSASQAVQGVLAQLARSQREGALRPPADLTGMENPLAREHIAVQAYVEMQQRLAVLHGNGPAQLWRPHAALQQLLSDPELGMDWTLEQQLELGEWRSGLAALDRQGLPEPFGMEIEADGSVDFQPGSTGPAPYARSQESWINTLRSWRMDMRLASQAGESFRLLSAD